MKKERKLDKVYAEFEQNYKGKSKEEMDKVASDLEKEIAGKESALEGKEGEERENLSKDVESKKKRLENLKGYSKNKEQIEKIKDFKGTLEKKLKKEEVAKEKHKKEIDKIQKRLSNVNKKLKDEKFTSSLVNEQYNNLLKEKEGYEKELNENFSKYCNAENRIIELQSKVSKCDLAWRTLFTNKDWDEIQRRATTDDKRYTRKLDENDIPLSQKQREARNNAKKEEIIQNDTVIEDEEIGYDIDQEDRDDAQQEIEEENQEKALVPVKKEGFFRRAWNKVKQFFTEPYRDGDEAESKEADGKEGPVKSERDEFLEALRKHVDAEYKQACMEEKVAREKEAHKAKTQTEQTNQEKEDDQMEI